MAQTAWWCKKSRWRLIQRIAVRTAASRALAAALLSHVAVKAAEAAVVATHVSVCVVQARAVAGAAADASGEVAEVAWEPHGKRLAKIPPPRPPPPTLMAVPEIAGLGGTQACVRLMLVQWQCEAYISERKYVRRTRVLRSLRSLVPRPPSLSLALLLPCASSRLTGATGM